MAIKFSLSTIMINGISHIYLDNFIFHAFYNFIYTLQDFKEISDATGRYCYSEVIMASTEEVEPK
jgi:hypothetical protein